MGSDGRVSVLMLHAALDATNRVPLRSDAIDVSHSPTPYASSP
jgi:hypothetical protein